MAYLSTLRLPTIYGPTDPQVSPYYGIHSHKPIGLTLDELMLLAYRVSSFNLESISGSFRLDDSNTACSIGHAGKSHDNDYFAETETSLYHSIRYRSTALPLGITPTAHLPDHYPFQNRGVGGAQYYTAQPKETHLACRISGTRSVLSMMVPTTTLPVPPVNNGYIRLTHVSKDPEAPPTFSYELFETWGLSVMNSLTPIVKYQDLYYPSIAIDFRNRYFACSTTGTTTGDVVSATASVRLRLGDRSFLLPMVTGILRDDVRNISISATISASEWMPYDPEDGLGPCYMSSSGLRVRDVWSIQAPPEDFPLPIVS